MERSASRTLFSSGGTPGASVSMSPGGTLGERTLCGQWLGGFEDKSQICFRI